MTRLTNHRPLIRISVLATVVAAVGFAAPLPARAADEVTHDRLLNADKEPANWLHHHKNFSATRFSSLKDINRDNVKNLKVAWTMHLAASKAAASGPMAAWKARRSSRTVSCM